MIRQIFTVSVLSLKSLRHRLVPSLVVVSGVACVVAVLVSVLSVTVGVVRAYSTSTDPSRIVILSRGATRAFGSSITPQAVNFVTALPGIRKAPDGMPLISPEVIAFSPVSKKNSGLNATIVVHGLSTPGFRLHTPLHIVSGRMFRPGAAEFIVGVGAQKQFTDLDVGDSFTVPHGQWRIVGTFAADGDIMEGELVGDASTLMPAIGRKSYNLIEADLTAPDRFSRFKADITTNPSIQLSPEPQSQYLARTTSRFASLFETVAYVIAGLMAVGAVMGTVNTLYTAVSARSREIATLRALGYGPGAVVVSVVLEAMLLALAGALIGAAAAWMLCDGRQKVMGTNVFNLSIDPSLVFLGILWALAIALVGAALPSIRVARMPVARALGTV